MRAFELMEAPPRVSATLCLMRVLNSGKLLSRMVHQDAKIEVNLYERTHDEDKRRYKAEEDRCRQFFGDRQMKFHSAGVVDFVEKNVLS